MSSWEEKKTFEVGYRKVGGLVAQRARLLCPWDFPGKNAGVGCHFLLQGLKGWLCRKKGLEHFKWHREREYEGCVCEKNMQSLPPACSSVAQFPSIKAEFILRNI